MSNPTTTKMILRQELFQNHSLTINEQTSLKYKCRLYTDHCDPFHVAFQDDIL